MADSNPLVIDITGATFDTADISVAGRVTPFRGAKFSSRISSRLIRDVCHWYASAVSVPYAELFGVGQRVVVTRGDSRRTFERVR